ncbi:MAG TPA: hypothetical protein PLZ31_11000 [Myxococcota bacterium]|nr:hypothetical protein [Myxococcota bacterium]HPB51736.1 hypothetical protein [Myxococcota bacterium]
MRRFQCLLHTIWLPAVAIVIAGSLSCKREVPLNEPPAVFLDGKPVSEHLKGMKELGLPEPPHKLPTKAEVIERVRASSLGNPVGRSEVRRLAPFRYLYRELAPGSIKTERDLVRAATELTAAVAETTKVHGRPFVLIRESNSGWLFNETIRVCVPVADSVSEPHGVPSDRFDGAMVLVATNRTQADGRTIDSMERWAEERLQAVTGVESDFSGPFMMRFDTLTPPVDGPLLWDWFIPVGPLPEPGKPGVDDRGATESGEKVVSTDGV